MPDPIQNQRAEPLYVVPAVYWADVPAHIQRQCVASIRDNTATIFIAPADFGEIVSYPDGDEPATMAEFRHLYTPTPEEVCRALRGPQGYPGPTGAMGATGAPGATTDADLTEVHARLADAERGVTAAMRAVTSLVTALLHTGVIDAETVLNHDQKEH